MKNTLKKTVLSFILSIVMILSIGSALAFEGQVVKTEWTAGGLAMGPGDYLPSKTDLACPAGFTARGTYTEQHGQTKSANHGRHYTQWTARKYTFCFKDEPVGFNFEIKHCDLGEDCSTGDSFTDEFRYRYDGRGSHNSDWSYAKNFKLVISGITPQPQLKSFATLDYSPSVAGSEASVEKTHASKIACGANEISLRFNDIYHNDDGAIRLYNICIAGGTTSGTPGTDTTPPGSVTNLAETSATDTSITWGWTNPTDSDFQEVVLELDGTQVSTTSGTTYTASSLTKATQHTLVVKSKDTTGNVETTGASDSAWTTGGTSTFTVTDVTVGGSSQARDATASGTVTIQNTGQAAIAVTSITANADSKYLVTFTNQPVTVAPGASATFTVNAHVPKDHDAVDSSCKPSAIQVGTFDVKAGSATQTGKLLMQAENKLEFDDVRVYVDGDKETVTDGDKVDVKPNSDIEVKAVVDNTFSSSSNNDIDDVELNVEVDDNDVDVDEDDDLGEIDAGDDATGTIEFDLDYDVDGSYDMDVKVCGEDKNKAKHGDNMKVELEVDKEKHDLIVDKVDMQPASITCSRDVMLNVKLANIGKNDEDSIVLKVTNSKLQVLEQRTVSEIEEGKTRVIAVPITISDSAGAGTYPFNVEVAYEQETLREQVTMVVGGCNLPTAPADQGQDSEDIEVMFTSGSGTGTTLTGVEGATDEVQVKSSHVAVLELAILSLLVVLLILGVVVYFKTRQKDNPGIEVSDGYYQATENDYFKTN